MKLCGHDAFSERLGINGRYASLGSAFAAAVLGGVAYYLSEGAVFIVTAALVIPALLTLVLFRDRIGSQRRPPGHAASAPAKAERASRPWHIFRDQTLHIFAVCVVLFHSANAAMLPLALNELAKRGGQSGLRGVGGDHRAAGGGRGVLALGRPPGPAARPPPVLLFGFAALPLRGLLFVACPDAMPLVVIQVLDGVSATVFGLTMPLIAADLTRRTGYLNLAIGSLGLAAGLGATASTTVAGWIADTFGAPAAFSALALVGLAAVATVWLA